VPPEIAGRGGFHIVRSQVPLRDDSSLSPACFCSGFIDAADRVGSPRTAFGPQGLARRRLISPAKTLLASENSLRRVPTLRCGWGRLPGV
jgi:hypothetical protein